MATYQLNQTKSDGTPVDPIEFTIPDEIGTYRVTFTTSDGKSFIGGNVEVASGSTYINQTVSGSARTMVTGGGYSYSTTINVGIGKMTNLKATPANSDTTLATATYDDSTGIITAYLFADKRLTNVSGTITGTLTTGSGSHTYRIDITLDNGQVIKSPNFVVGSDSAALSAAPMKIKSLSATSVAHKIEIYNDHFTLSLANSGNGQAVNKIVCRYYIGNELYTRNLTENIVVPEKGTLYVYVNGNVREFENIEFLLYTDDYTYIIADNVEYITK